MEQNKSYFLRNFKLSRASIILIQVSTMVYFAGGLLAPLFAIFAGRVGGSLFDIGFAYALYCICIGVFIFFVGRTKFFVNNSRKFIVIGYFLYAAGYAGYLFVRNPMGLFIVQIMLGVAGGMLEPLWDGIFSAKLSEKQASKNWALWAGSINIATGIAAIIGSIIVAKLSFQVLFIIMAALSFIAALNSIRLLYLKKEK